MIAIHGYHSVGDSSSSSKSNPDQLSRALKILLNLGVERSTAHSALYGNSFNGSDIDSSSGDDYSSVLDQSTPGVGEVSTTDILDYIDGLITNQGLENMLNRQYNSAENAANRAFQSHEAQIQRDWYESMSNTAYTRAMADMKNAGLNPILAYAQGGAASSGTGVPAGSAASYTATGGDTVSSLLSSLAELISSIGANKNGQMSNLYKIMDLLFKNA